MPLRDAIAALVASVPSGTLIPVGWLAEQLAADTTPAQHVEPCATGAAVDLTVEQVAERFGRGTSTVRTWLERNELPGAYKLHGREWRIPASAIASMQRAEAVRHERKPRPARSKAADIGDWRNHLPKKAS